MAGYDGLVEPGPCAAGQVPCGTECVFTDSNNAHCGVCGNACAPGSACLDGMCVCQSGLTSCADQCVDTASNAQHCGVCGNACAAGQVCSAGMCAATCAPGTTQCGPSCVDVQTSWNHCGACNVTCDGGRICQQGSCVCPGGLTFCAGSCVDTLIDPSHCGGCGIVCASGSCVSGSCSGGTGGTGGGVGTGATGGTAATGGSSGTPGTGGDPGSGGSGAELCSDDCRYAGDGECDDGGPGADYAVCPLGTDCTDCGPRSGAAGSGGAGGTGGTGGSAGLGGSGGSGGSCQPDLGCRPAAPSTGDFYADCVARINQFRACMCLPLLQRWTEAESCADQQAEYDSTRGAHAGYSADICSPGGRGQNECTGSRSISAVIESCLQYMFDEGPGPEGCADDYDCFLEHGHHLNMVKTSNTKVACGYYITPEGRVWSVQNFGR